MEQKVLVTLGEPLLVAAVSSLEATDFKGRTDVLSTTISQNEFPFSLGVWQNLYYKRGAIFVPVPVNPDQTLRLLHKNSREGKAQEGGTHQHLWHCSQEQMYSLSSFPGC